MKVCRFVIALRTVTAVIVVVLFSKAFVVTSCTIPSTGMENSLYQGERVLVNKWSYGLRLPFSTVRWMERPMKKGDVIVFNNPNPTEINTKIYNREIFVGRCVGAPGDTLMLNDELSIDNDRGMSPDSKLLFSYPHEAESSLLPALRKFGIDECSLVGYQKGNYIRSLSRREYDLLQQELKGKWNLAPVYEDNMRESRPFMIPAKGLTVKIHPWNVKLLCNTISRHEGKLAAVRNDILYVNGFPVTSYIFSKNYCWVVSDNPVNLCDSRLFGLVPDTHWIGRVGSVWFSTRKGRLFSNVR